jgi:uncharacterized membrane protein
MLRTKAVLALPLAGLIAGWLWAVLPEAVPASSAAKMQKIEIAQADHEGHRVEILLNSETLSQATAINALGAMIGSREVANADKTILRSVSFFCKADQSADMPVPVDFTNVEACAISDNDVVVGYASRPIGHPEGSLRAVVWKPFMEKLEILPLPDDDSASHAQDISADGTRISGYSTGHERLRPVVWQWREQTQAWEFTVLTTHFDYNPYLMSSTLLISPDGQIAAGCCTQAILPDGSIDSALLVWRYRDGLWHPQQLTAEQLYVRGLNNLGQIVGSNLGKKGRQPCYLSPTGELQVLDLLPGDHSGEARDINSQGMIVGWSDGPPGPEGGPKACRWNADGNIQPLRLSADPFSMVYAINDAGQLSGMITLPSPDEAEKRDGAIEPAGKSLAFRTLPTK